MNSRIITFVGPALPLMGFLALPVEVAAEPGGVAALHALIKPGNGESRWMEIDWHPGVWEGRQLAAAAGKPILFMAGSGGAPCAGC
ncbi:MAG: hypothetical protein GWO24_02400 [Akkermansiaceae bacterium]|nr:hypothetical protein [Akkermansiaceae bacterium]